MTSTEPGGGPALRIAHHAAIDPLRTALETDDEEVSFGQLDALVRRQEARMAADRLDRHVVALPRGVEQVVAVAATLLHGGIIACVDPTTPQSRRRRVSDLLHQAVGVSGGYVVTTSGTTGGRPKAVHVPLTSLHWHTRTTARCYDLRPGDRVAHLASPGFDVAHEELWPTLASGATVVVSSADIGAVSFDAFSQWVADRGITVLNLPSGYFAGWVRSVRPDRAFPALRLVVVGSEPLDPACLPRAMAALPGVRLVNAYGTSECTITALVHDIRPDDAQLRTVPVGRPLPGAAAVVVDDDARPVPLGAVGELAVCGPGVASRYLGADADQDARYVRLDHAGGVERAYLTGDMARWTTSGIELLGRRDDQLSVRGVRVEPAEVESALLAVPDVTEACALVDGDQLLAFVVGGDGPEPRDAVRDVLPPPMVPARVVRVERMPLTPGGKRDRDALRLLATSAAHDRVDACRVADIWREVLGVPSVESDANFFELGGSSLRAARLVAEIADRWGVSMPLESVFARPCLDDFTEAVLAASDGDE